KKKDSGRRFPIMSGRKKSLLKGMFGKNKDEEDPGKGKKTKAIRLERVPSTHESMQSRSPTEARMSHRSDAPLHYEEHHGAPVTAVHEEDPYSPYDGGSMMRQPSTINVRPPSQFIRASQYNPHLHHHDEEEGGYFEQPFSDSPRGTLNHHANVHEPPFEHVETAHPAVVNLGEHEHAGGGHPGHVAVAGLSRQGTPRMLKPGDKMEIDPRNPPTFVVDEGVTLEIGDDENGYIPYEEYLANLAKQPPPKTGGTYIVQGGGDVVIQDDAGNVIRTIPGTGAMAGRGPPQIHEPPHIIPVLVPISRRKSTPRKAKIGKERKPLPITRARPRVSLAANEFRSPEFILEPPTIKNSFSSIMDLVNCTTISQVIQVGTKTTADIPEKQRSPKVEVKEKLPVTDAKPQVSQKVEVTQETQKSESTPQHQEQKVQDPIANVITAPLATPSAPSRSVPEPPSAVVEELEQQRLTPVQEASDTTPSSAVSGPPMTSPNSLEEFDAADDADSDLALNRPGIPFGLSTANTVSISTALKPFPSLSMEPHTPVEELSDLSEIILSPSLMQRRVSAATTAQSTESPKTASTPRDTHRPAIPSPERTRRSVFTEEPVLIEETLASNVTPPPAYRPTPPTLIHSQAQEPTPLPGSPSNESQPSTPPPPRPVRNPTRSLRGATAPSLPTSLPIPPANAVLRTAHRNPTAPIPIPTSTVNMDRATQPRMNASPKLRALIQKFEGGSNDGDDFANNFIGNTRAMTPGRRGSGASDMVKVDSSSLWSSYTPPSSRPGTPNMFSEFGEKLMMERLIERDILNAEATHPYREGRTVNNDSREWDLRPVAASAS
ncbi:2987_t:CDS:2, partial [Acaulospora colombiana]